MSSCDVYDSSHSEPFGWRRRILLRCRYRVSLFLLRTSIHSKRKRRLVIYTRIFEYFSLSHLHVVFCDEICQPTFLVSASKFYKFVFGFLRQLSTWHCSRLLLSAVLRRHCCWTPGGRRCRSTPCRAALCIWWALRTSPCRTLTPWVKKNKDTKLLPITSQNVNRFSKFFHCQTQWQICIKLCRYTTLWNTYLQKIAILKK